LTSFVRDITECRHHQRSVPNMASHIAFIACLILVIPFLIVCCDVMFIASAEESKEGAVHRCDGSATAPRMDSSAINMTRSKHQKHLERQRLAWRRLPAIAEAAEEGAEAEHDDCRIS